MLGAKISAVPPEFKAKAISRTNPCVMQITVQPSKPTLRRFRSALESPFARSFYTALPPPAARFDNPVPSYYSFS